MPDAPARSRGFAPVVNDRTRILILGSLPGVVSLAAGQYYAHPRNAFWPIIGELVGQDMAGLPYERRLDVIKAAGVGLWDVLASAERSGSLDAAIKSPEAADLSGLVAGLPALEVVAFNGGAAAKIGRRILQGLSGNIALVDLPSSSPAHARPLAEKVRKWREALAGHLA